MTASTPKTKNPKIQGIYAGYVKRLLDIVFSLVGLTVTAIPLLLFMLVIYLQQPGPVIFRQQRVGKNAKTFTLYKLRTMLLLAPPECPTSQMMDTYRWLLPIGAFLRKTSLDELPQLVNVLKGDMSLVGPRPLIVEEQAIHRLRTEYGVYQLRPGITGLVQVNGRDTLTDGEKARFDASYAGQIGFFTDVKILLATAVNAVIGKDVVEGKA